LRNLLLKVHLYLGLAAAIILVILGLTGAVIAFEFDIDHWMHRSIWYVKTGTRILPEEDLVRAAQERFAPARVAAIQIWREANLVQVMQMTDRTAVYVNPYDGSIQGRTMGQNRTQRTLGAIHQIHLRLAPDPRSMPAFSAVGKKIISIAGLFLVVLVPTGFILWWRTRRASIKFGGSWFRICFDAHHAIGIYAALFLLIAAITGVMIGFDFGEEAIYAFTHSERPKFEKPPQSTPVPGAKPIAVNKAVEIARGAMPEATVAVIQLPLNPKAAYNVQMRVPEETSEAVHSTVTIDQFSGQVLRVINFKTDSMGYRVIRFNRSIHTGDVLGTPTHIIVSLSSLLLVAMVLTGVVIWWKKLAV
jgi:uncharacterized iron-regulated membrane protein